MKKGDIWIAAVIYIAIGVIILTLIVAAGVPLINDMRDRNTYVQTKDVMNSIDDAITSVVSEGPGSRRALNPIIIKKGDINIIIPNKIYWQMQTKAKILETYKSKSEAKPVNEKNLQIIEYNDKLLVDYYNVEIALDYTGKNINLKTEGETSKLTGKFGLIITNEGYETNTGIGQQPTNIKIKII